MARKQPETHPFLTKLRQLAASFPETEERLTWGHPTFRVRDKIFASFGEHDERPVISCKQTHAGQTQLVEDGRFFVAPYVGKHGWIGIFVDEVEWPMIADLVETSYCMIAPKKLARLLDE